MPNIEIHDPPYYYLFPQTVAYTQGRADLVKELAGEKTEGALHPVVPLTAGLAAGGAGGMLLKEYLTRSLAPDDNTRLLYNAVPLATALMGGGLASYLTYYPDIQHAKELASKMNKTSMDWDTVKEYAGNTEALGLYLMGTGVAAGGLTYLMDKDRFKKALSRRLAGLEKKVRAEDLKKGHGDNWVENKATFSLSGPGIMTTPKGMPIGTNIHSTGAGVVYNIKDSDVYKFLKNWVPFVSKDTAQTVRDYTPPNMYLGAELSALTPLAAGVIVDPANKEGTLTKIRRIRGLLEDKDFEKKVDKKVYGKMSDIASGISKKLIG